MKNIVVAALLAVPSASFADDPILRDEFETRYSVADAAGGYAAPGRISSSYTLKDLSGNKITWSQLVGKRRIDYKRKTTVDSADMLKSKAKAALSVTEIETILDHGRRVKLQREYTAVDTWVRVDQDWVLTETRLTRNVVIKDGKVVLTQSEKVRTDFDRQYGRRPSGGTRGRSGSRS